MPVLPEEVSKVRPGSEAPGRLPQRETNEEAARCCGVVNNLEDGGLGQSFGSCGMGTPDGRKRGQAPAASARRALERRLDSVKSTLCVKGQSDRAESALESNVPFHSSHQRTQNHDPEQIGAKVPGKQ